MLKYAKLFSNQVFKDRNAIQNFTKKLKRPLRGQSWWRLGQKFPQRLLFALVRHVGSLAAFCTEYAIEYLTKISA